MAEALIQPVWEIVRCLWDPIVKRINCVRKLQKNLDELCKKASELGIKRDDINHEIERLKPQKTPTKGCEDWKTKVGAMEKKIETINQEFNVRKKCFIGLCPDIFSRIDLGERVLSMIEEAKELLEKSKFENGFLTDSPPPKVEKQPDPASKLTNSAHRTLERVLNKIRDKSSAKIGIWGMGGVGKTTVMQLLNNTPEITTMFDLVIWLTVSKSWNISKLQHEVGKRLSLEIKDDDSEGSVAIKLSQKLEGKKYLLLLDDLWEKVDLSVVGFPNVSQDNGCKVVLTTREFQVCQKMETDIDIKVAVLSEDESWEMFTSKVGDVAMFPTIKPLAEEIVKKCGGLPLALKVVSSALRKRENVNVWREFLNELKSPATSFIKDMNNEVFMPLKVSYDKLEDPQIKNCFLYCGLYPEDWKIKKSQLIYYWRAEGLLSSKLTLEKARVKGDAILQVLIDSSLLEKCEGDDKYVKLHDVVRDLVLTMTSPKEECTHLVRAGISTNEIPEDDEWEKATRISFIGSGLRNLPASPNCPMLLTLLLQSNQQLDEIPVSFFNNMPKLRVLDLSSTDIKSLPISISNLVSLRALLLNDCFCLESLPEEVRKLKRLEMLEVRGTFLRHLPLCISELTALKCLKFYFNNCTTGLGFLYLDGYLKVTVPGGVICSLPRIEVIKLYGLGDESVDILAKELSNLNALSSLVFNFRSVSNLQHFIQNSKPWRDGRINSIYFIVNERGGHYDVQGYNQVRSKYKMCLHYAGGGGGEGNNILPSTIKDVLSHSNCFMLEGHEELNTLSEVGALNTYQLRCCAVFKCNALENVVDRTGLEMNSFPILESLTLTMLPNLRFILYLELEEGPAAAAAAPPVINSFTNLRELAISYCPRIKKLFSSGFMIRLLSNLKVLRIGGCQGLEEMISKDEIKIEYEALPKLEVVELYSLPELVSFFEGVPMCWFSLKVVKVVDCPKLRKLPFNVNNGAGLEEIRGDQEWWDALEWDDNAIQLRLRPLFRQQY